MKPIPTKMILGYSTAIVLPCLSLLLQLSVDTLSSNETWLFFYPAIFLAAWFGGTRPGVLCTIVCGVLAAYFLIEPKYQFSIQHLAPYIQIVIFGSMGFLISFMMGQIHQGKISSLHHAELKKSREFLHTLLENIPLMVFVKDAKDLRFIRFNKAGEDLLGYNRSDLIGKNDRDFFTAEQADFFILKDQAVLSDGQILDIKEETIQTRLQGARILHTKKIPLYGPDGAPEYLLGVSEDITEKKKSEEKSLEIIREQAVLKERELAHGRETFLADASTLLASSLDYHVTLQELAKLAVSVLGDWCTVTIVNEEGTFERPAAAHCDPAKDDLIQEYLKNYPPEGRATNVIGPEGHVKSFYNPEIQESELKAMVKDDHHLDLLHRLGSSSSMIVPIRARGRTLGSLSFISGPARTRFTPQDLALAEELGRRAGIALDNALLYKAAQVAIKARDEFMSIASHELKTPITSLKMQIQMMQRGVNVLAHTAPSPEKLEKAFTNSSRQIDRLTALIEDLLDISRIETGKLTYRFEEVNLSGLMKEVIERFQEQLKLVGCETELDLEEGIGCKCDRYRIEQVVTNLISNAMKYGAGFPVKISLRTEGSWVVMQMLDHGMGIASEMHGKIFERFERAISSTNISGLGLGLYISKQIVDAHRGRIEVQSEIKKGSTFKVYLPKSV